MAKTIHKLTKAEHELAQRQIKKQDLVLTCIHVIEQTADGIYRKRDDSYCCKACQDAHNNCGKVCQCIGNLIMIHRSCLGI